MTWVKDLIASLRGVDRDSIPCDGCEGNFPIDGMSAASGDVWLCQECFRRWYPEYFETKT